MSLLTFLLFKISSTTAVTIGKNIVYFIEIITFYIWYKIKEGYMPLSKVFNKDNLT
jgi:hypothetical protein